MRLDRWPLWLQLTSAMAAASVAVALVAGHVMRAIETDYLRDELRRESLRTSEALTLALARPVAAGNAAELELLVGRTRREDATLHSLALLDGAGQTVSRWVAGESAAAAAGSVFYYSIPTQIPARGLGKLVVSWDVAALVRRIEEHVDRLRFNVFLTIGLLGIVLVTLVHFLVMRPVDALRRGLDRYARGESNARVRLSPFAASELDRLAQSVGELGRYQRALRETQDSLERARLAAESASDAKGRFLAVMSHEIRTPINGVIGSLELLSEGLGPTQRNLVANAQRSADSLLEIINEILDFSRVESGQLKLEQVEFPLEEQLNDVAGGMTGLVDHDRVELVVDFDPSLPARVLGDPLRLRQVLTNLLGNAVKFTERGGVVLRARRIDGETMRLEVRDTGIGIAEDKQQALFEPFTQADTSTTRQFGGTGLGLSICKQLVELMDGSLGLESTPGEGSCFWADLPIRTSAEPRALVDERIAGRRALLVEDDPFASAAIRRYLESFGATVAVGGAAMPVLERLPAEAADADLIVVDAVLANRSGGSGFLYALRAVCAPDATLVLLVPPGVRVPEGAPIDVALLKPVKRVELFESLLGPDAAPASEEPAQQPSKRADARVLLVDDNPMNLEVAAAMLARLGLDADTATSGEEALARCGDTRYDVVLMDEQMPGMDGLEATRRIRAGDGVRVPIVALTANADAAAERRCLEAGMDAFLAKPVRRKALEEMLARWIPGLGDAASRTTPG